MKITQQEREELVKSFREGIAGALTVSTHKGVRKSLPDIDVDDLKAEDVSLTKYLRGAILGNWKEADAQAEHACRDLKAIKAQISELEAREEQLTAFLQNLMQNYSELRSVDGTTLVTWKAAKASKRFNAGLFQQAMPEIYQQFVVETPGSRRFLVK